MLVLRQKEYMQLSDGTFAPLLELTDGKKGAEGVAAVKKNSEAIVKKNAEAAAKRQAERAARKANPSKFAFNKGVQSATFKQGAMNTWNKMGTMSKAGVIAGGAVAGGLMLRGLFGGKKKERSYSANEKVIVMVPENSVGILKGAKNSWNKLGRAGKAGVVAGTAATAGVVAHKIIKRKKENK